MYALNKLKKEFPYVAEWRLKALIEIDNEKPFSMNKWYCYYCGIVSENSKRARGFF